MKKMKNQRYHEINKKSMLNRKKIQKYREDNIEQKKENRGNRYLEERKVK
jgi:hypothetical protein